MTWLIDRACKLEKKQIGGEQVLIVHLHAEKVSQICIGLCLLKEGLVSGLKLCNGSTKGYLNLKRSDSALNRIQFGADGTSSTLSVGAVTLDMMLHFFLRTVRDGVAEVDHIDLEVEPSDGVAGALVIKFPDSAQPLDAEAAKRRLGI